MSRKMTAVAPVALVTLAGCLDDGEFGGSGGSGGSSAAGERLAHQVCTEAVRDEGLRVVDIYKTNSVDYRFPRAGVDFFFSTRRDPMTVSLSYTRCRFMYDSGRATLHQMTRRWSPRECRLMVRTGQGAPDRTGEIAG